MGRYGKNMRDCCDSLAQHGTPHIRGCVNYRVTRTARFIRMDDSTDTVKLETGFYDWLTERKLRLKDGDASCGGLAEIQTIVECDGVRAGIVMTVEYSEAA